MRNLKGVGYEAAESANLETTRAIARPSSTIERPSHHMRLKKDIWVFLKMEIPQEWMIYF